MVFFLKIGYVDASGPTRRAKRCDDAKRSHTKPESPVRQAWTALDSNQGVPVNLTCKLIRKQQTVKFKSVSAGFPNHPYAMYRQGSADTENDNKSSIKSVY